MKTKILTLSIFFATISIFCYKVYATTGFFSDCQSNVKVLGEVVNQMVVHKPDTVFIAGDITYYGSRQDDFDYFFQTVKPLTDIASIYPAFGNHDKDTDLFLKHFPQVDSLTYYTKESDGVLWIILNSNLKLAPGSTQYNWLLNQLETNLDRTKIVMMHHPVYSSGAHGDEKGFSFLFPSLFKSYKVSAVFSGHDHIYERSERDSTYYIVFGGAGGNLYDNVSKNDYSKVFSKTNGYIILTREGSLMQVKAYRLDGMVIDSFSFSVKEQPPTLQE